jgi:hypothetical protein
MNPDRRKENIFLDPKYYEAFSRPLEETDKR